MSEGRVPIVANPATNHEAETIRTKIIEQFRRRELRPRSFGSILFNLLALVGSLASVIGLLLLFWPSGLDVARSYLGLSAGPPLAPNDSKDFFLISITFFSLVWAVYRTSATPTRASEEVYFSHQAAHIVRDYLSSRRHDEASEREAVNEILHAAEKAFELVTKRKCSALVKTVSDSDGTVYVSHSSDITAYPIEAQTSDHFSEYSSIVSITRDDGRSYVCNDVWMAFRNGNYEHPKLKSYVHKGIWRQLYRLVIEYVWPPRSPISFRSTLVVPIRHFHYSGNGNLTQTSPYKYAGFLCIDSKSRRSFKSRVITEIAALYADAICSIFLASKLSGDSTA